MALGSFPLSLLSFSPSVASLEGRVPGPTLRGRDGVGRGDGAGTPAPVAGLLPLAALLLLSNGRRDDGGAPPRPRSDTLALGDSARCPPPTPDAELLRGVLPDGPRVMERAMRCRPRSAAGEAKPLLLLPLLLLFLALLLLLPPTMSGSPGGGSSGGGGGGMPGDELGGRIRSIERDKRSTDLARRSLEERFDVDASGLCASSLGASFIFEDLGG